MFENFWTRLLNSNAVWEKVRGREFQEVFHDFKEVCCWFVSISVQECFRVIHKILPLADVIGNRNSLEINFLTLSIYSICNFFFWGRPHKSKYSCFIFFVNFAWLIYFSFRLSTLAALSTIYNINFFIILIFWPLISVAWMTTVPVENRFCNNWNMRHLMKFMLQPCHFWFINFEFPVKLFGNLRAEMIN